MKLYWKIYSFFPIVKFSCVQVSLAECYVFGVPKEDKVQYKSNNLQDKFVKYVDTIPRIVCHKVVAAADDLPDKKISGVNKNP